MLKRLTVIASSILLILILAGSASADMFTEFVWYREEPQFERIVISRERVRGRVAVDYADEHESELQEKGFYQTYYYDGSGKKEITKETSMSGSEIKTVINIFPPSGSKAFPKVFLKVYIDGTLRLDTHIGHRFIDDWIVNKVCVNPGDKSIVVNYEGYDIGEEYLNWGLFNERLVDNTGDSTSGTKALITEKNGK